eukprot:8515359-Alexandrium_andersonii.AAC.1
MDSATGPAAIPRLLAAGNLWTAGKRCAVLMDAVARPQAMPSEGPEPAERAFRALQRLAEDGVGPRGSIA